MAKRHARPRKQKPRSVKSAKKKAAKKMTARKAAPKPKARASAQKKRSAKARRAAARTARPKPAALSRPRRKLPDEEIVIPSPPSTLGYAPKASGAESGHQKYHQRALQHASEDPSLTAGDIDADWNEAYSSGEEAPGGDTPTPDQDVVEEIGRALGVEYEDAEELKGAEKIEARDKHRWEFDPASAEDYRDRNKKQ